MARHLILKQTIFFFLSLGFYHSSTLACNHEIKNESEISLDKIMNMFTEENIITDCTFTYQLDLDLEFLEKKVRVNNIQYEAFCLRSGGVFAVPQHLSDRFMNSLSNPFKARKLLGEWQPIQNIPNDKSGITLILYNPQTREIMYFAENEHLQES